MARKRTGFTLIELLVVIAIMAALAALAAGTYFRIRSSQMVSATESSLQQLSTGLDRIVSAQRDKAEKEFNDGKLPNNNSATALINFCGGASNRDRAKAVWLYLRMKNEFPQTFLEAHQTINLFDGSNIVVRLPPLQTFAKVPNVAAATYTGDPDREEKERAAINEQAAVLLYIILTEKTVSGESHGADVSTARTKQITVNGSQFTVFIDSWGTPLTYARWYTTQPAMLVNDHPIARYAASSVPAGVSQDPFDVSGKMLPTAWVVPGPAVDPKGTAARLAIGFTGTTGERMGLVPWNRTFNWIPTIISAGANRRWDIFDLRGLGLTPTTRMPENNIGIIYDPIEFTSNGSPITTDNVYSYRLRQFGARGD